MTEVTIQQTELEVNIINPFDDLIKSSISSRIEKLNVKEELQPLAGILEISIYKEDIKLDKSGKPCKQTNKNKKDLVSEIKMKLYTLTIDQQIHIIKDANIGFELEVKNILEKNVNIDELIESGICLPLNIFLEDNPCLQELFVNTCDLENINNCVKSTNCVPFEVQGLYALTICKNEINYIVKLGSFAESQGMFKRICSFGGGNHETGSLTNKWFQRFIKKALAEGYTSKFTYYNKIQEKISITDLSGNQIEMMPYVMRPLETQLFQKYSKSNHNIPPIFGSNCL